MDSVSIYSPKGKPGTGTARGEGRAFAERKNFEILRDHGKGGEGCMARSCYERKSDKKVGVGLGAKRGGG